MGAVPEEPEHDPHDGEDLPKMSFGDHLEELRKRVLLSGVAIAICVFSMLFIKDRVTDIYLAPYRDMWRTGFVEYADGVIEEVAKKRAAGQEVFSPGLLGDYERDQYAFLTGPEMGQILDGTFPFDKWGHKIKDIGGFQVPYYLIAIGGIEDFWTFMAACVLFALILSSPFVLYQIWAFIGAGLYKRERKVVLKYVPAATGLLMAGTSFGYFVVVPYGLFFLVKLMNFGFVQPMFTVSNYFSFLFTLTAALGFVFQLPLVMLALQKAGIASHAAQRKHWRYVILGMFLASAMLTPPDPFTQVMMGLPLCTLYAIGLVVTARSERRAPQLHET